MLTEGRGSNAGTCIINLKDWSERKQSVKQIIEELEEDDILTLEEDESGEDDEDRVKDNDELADEVELWALEEELSALLSAEEEHEA